MVSGSVGVSMQRRVTQCRGGGHPYSIAQLVRVPGRDVLAWPRQGWRGGACGAGFAAVCALLLSAVHWIDARLGADAPPARTAARVLAGDDWNDRIRSEDYWRAGRVQRNAAPPVSRREEASEQRASQGRSGSKSGAYRTVCVRLCDGYSFPINFSTSADDLDRDAAQCERSCSSPARLFTQRNLGEEFSELVDLKGQPYSRLKTANLFRTSYDESCKCKPHPWEQAAIDKHRLFALDAARAKGNKLVAAEIADLRSKLRKAAVAERAKSAGATVAAVAPGQQLSLAGKGRAGPRAARVDQEAAAVLAAGAMAEMVVMSPGTSAAPPVVLPVTGAPLPVGDSIDGAGPSVTGIEAGQPRVAARQRQRQAMAPREGIMRLGAGEHGRAAGKRADNSQVARSSGDWVRRTFGQN